MGALFFSLLSKNGLENLSLRFLWQFEANF